MNLRQMLTAPNQLTLLRMIFLPFIVINVVGHTTAGRWCCLSSQE